MCLDDICFKFCLPDKDSTERVTIHIQLWLKVSVNRNAEKITSSAINIRLWPKVSAMPPSKVAPTRIPARITALMTPLLEVDDRSIALSQAELLNYLLCNESILDLEKDAHDLQIHAILTEVELARLKTTSRCLWLTLVFSALSLG